VGTAASAYEALLHHILLSTCDDGNIHVPMRII
jgi:hypothetical protein